MGRINVYVVGLVLLVLLFGGCIGEGDLEPEQDDEDQEHPERGRVTGRIFTVDLDPIEDAVVRFVMDGELAAEVTTDPSGGYAVDGLAPGHYRLQASATCCQQAVGSVQVIAGESTTADLQMEPYSDDDLKEPRVERYEWQGQIGCSVRVNSWGFNLGCADPNEDLVEAFEVRKGLKTLVVGMDWEPIAQNVNEELVLRHYKGDTWSGNTVFRVNSAPPIEVRVGEAEAVDGEPDSYKSVTHPTEYRFEVWTGGSNSVSYQQKFTVWYHLYYWEPAPEDASALPDQ